MLISDIHTESWETQDFVEFDDRLDNYEYIIVAGDLGRIKYLNKIHKALQILVSKANHIIWVPGNHEYIGALNIANGDHVLRTIVDSVNSLSLGKIYFLNCDKLSLNIKGEDIHFLGCTLWTRNQLHTNPPPRDWQLTSEERYITHIKHKTWLRYNLEQNKDKYIVITHQPPTERFYEGDDYPEYYHNPLDVLVEDCKYWCFGHVHSSHTYISHSGKMVYANPVGTKAENKLLIPCILP
jgi:Icc-related predicted phosphoesterase